MNNCTRSDPALIFLALGLLLLPAPGQAHFPAFYGKEFIRSEPARQAEHPPSPTVPAASMDEADADSFKQQLKAQELLGGPYAEATTDPLSSLARYHRDRGDYREAEDLYVRALHVVRVNDGLYSERQIPLVRGLLNLYREKGDMKALDDRYHYFFNLFGGGQPPYTALRKRASMEYLRWQRTAHNSGLDHGSNKRLVDLYFLNSRMLKWVAQTPDVEESWHRELVLSQIRNLYLALGSGVSGGFSGQPALEDQQMSMIHRLGFGLGRSLLHDLIARSPQIDPIERASLHLELGDWYQWNQILLNANNEYAKVEQILLEAGELDLLDQWLGAPVELPANDAFWQPNQLPGDVEPIVATIHFDISAKGQLSHIKVSTKEPEDAPVGWRIKRMLKDTHFRPRFVSGHAEPVEQLTRQYQLVQ